MTDWAQMARELFEAERTGVPVDPPTTTYPGLTIAQAYDIQQAGLDLRTATGARVIGYKIGLTSLAMQEMLGVDQPDFGYLTDRMIDKSGCVLSPRAFIAPRVEAEIAFRLSRPLKAGEIDIEEVMAATDAVAPALEVIDSRVVDWRIGIADTIADNASSGYVVIGDWSPAHGLELPNLATEFVVTASDGTQETVSGRGEAVLGHPANAVEWLARALRQYGGKEIAAGEILLSGAMARALPFPPGSTAHARIDELGEVTATLEQTKGED